MSMHTQLLRGLLALPVAALLLAAGLDRAGCGFGRTPAPRRSKPPPTPPCPASSSIR